MAYFHVQRLRDINTVVAAVGTPGDSDTLDPRHDLFNHSPDGFEFGYSGSGPAQLALAMCAHVTQDDARALEVYPRFKEVFVSRIPQELMSWTVSVLDVKRIIEEL